MAKFFNLWPVLVFLILSLLPACRSGPKESTLDRIQREKKIKVGFANEAPFAYLDSKTGRLTGEAPEIARAVLKNMGVTEIEGVLTEFGSLIPGLKAGRFDMIAAGMYVTPQRAKEIAFTQPTYCLGGAFLVQKGNPLDLHSYADVAKNPKVRLGIMAGAVERDYARETNIPEGQLSYFPDPVSAMEGVAVDRVDAFAATRLTARDLLAKRAKKDLELAEPFKDPVIGGRVAKGCGAFGLRKTDTRLLKALNQQLEDFVGSPTHLKLIGPFGFTKQELPGEVSLETLTQN